jgi:hypothetical protein
VPPEPQCPVRRLVSRVVVPCSVATACRAPRRAGDRSIEECRFRSKATSSEKRGRSRDGGGADDATSGLAAHADAYRCSSQSRWTNMGNATRTHKRQRVRILSYPGRASIARAPTTDLHCSAKPLGTRRQRPGGDCMGPEEDIPQHWLWRFRFDSSRWSSFRNRPSCPGRLPREARGHERSSQRGPLPPVATSDESGSSQCRV